jgi:tagatose 1,6-diphosphate aldolase GatY/KbaY
VIVPFGELLEERRNRAAAAGAFTCYNLETASGVVRAAADLGVGVILLVSEQSFRAPGGDLLLSALRAVAERAPVPACVQLDHVADLELIEAAFELGAGAVMADGSRLPAEENAELVRRAVETGRRLGGEVEAELGHVAGDEDVARAAAIGALTDPDEAASFVAATEAACLAVSIGNVHGIYRRPPALDWPRLVAIRERVSVPLSLHGASGLPNADLRRAVSHGIAKVNVSTELRERYLATLAERLEGARDGARVLELGLALTEAVAAAVDEKLATLAPRG